jgi:hypothetical protein
MHATAKSLVRGCLIGLAAALLLVGVVSGTLLRHVVQILPILVVLIIMRRRPDWAAYAAMPILILWLAIMVLIWLFLLGLSRIANGHYTLIEIVLTFVMAACSMVGLVKSFAVGRSTPIRERVTAFVLFAVMQVAAMWVSFLGPIANR